MADYSVDDFDDSFNTRVRESFNTTSTTSTTNLAADIDNVGNADNSVNDSGNLDVELEGVGNVDSNDTTIDLDGSFNDYSDNSTHDHSDNSTNGSYNDGSQEIIEGSYNSHVDESVDDNSVNVGNREYNTGFGDLSPGGGGGGGDTWVNSQDTIVDQSFNANIDAWGGVDGGGGNSALVASGTGAFAAGNDVNLSQTMDRSTDISGAGDVNIGNTTQETNIVGSYNEEIDSSAWTDSSVELDVDDSFNDESSSYAAENSFNDELVSQTENTWDIDADVIWGSEDAGIGDMPKVDDGFDGS